MNRTAKAPSSVSISRQGSSLGTVVRGALAFALALAAFLGIGVSAALAAAPTATINPATGVTATSAEVSGEVNPEGAATTWTFQYISAEAFDENLENSAPGFQGAASGPTGSTETAEPVTGDLTGLDPGTRYHLRLSVESSEGTGEAVAPTFKTPGAAPLVKAWAAGPVASTSADINAQIDPLGQATVYWFEWGTENCETGPCTSIPAEHDASAGAGQIYTYVFRHLTGLQPETTYHFRVVAKNDSGTTAGDDQTFTTAAAEPACANQGMPGTATLPDCRAYEMVSPPDKNGADVLLNSYKTFAAANGDGVSYPAMGAFGDVRGTSTDVQYLSRRTAQPGTNGWSTHAISPLGGASTLLPLYFSNVPTFEAAFTPDLTGAIYKSWRPLTDSPEVADVSNLYRIRDLDASAPAPQLLTDSTAPLKQIFDPNTDRILKLAFVNAFDAASEDLSHVVFQSPWNLTSDAADGGGSFTAFSGGNLYEYADGVGVRAVGRVPTGSASECDDAGTTPCEAAPGAKAGISASIYAGSTGAYSDGMISADGSRILFTTPSGAIYMREDGERTYQLNASEKSPPESPAPAQVWAMSRDGSRVLFTTAGSLLEEDEDGGGSDLYMYEVGKPAGQRLTLISRGPTGISVTGVFGASADGRYVYFISDGRLIPGEPAEVLSGLYLWHDGSISYIGQFPDANEITVDTPLTGWGAFTQTKTSRVSPDGRYLLFMAKGDAGFAGRGGYAGHDHGTCIYGGEAPCRELYLYSAESGRLACVSCNTRSGGPISDALTDVHAGGSGSAPTQHLSEALSDDGRHVFFSTQEALVPEDTNGRWDAYEYDTATGTAHLISSGTDSADSYFLDASPDGHDVFFATRERLVGWDTDQNYDVYDARVDGGLPEPVPVPAACQGESCLPSAPPSPAAQPTASQVAGPGNPEPRRCPRGTRAVRHHGKTRCVKKHRSPHKRHARVDHGTQK